ncbi:hypothetical protein [Nonomuraea indica]|uniref:hypothetical protein n=1 Tax=Nonomuraea indica TaxID=1581193 RepID=UPI00118294D8|nr:hypothetical protein [Nonomuraea indica]
MPSPSPSGPAAPAPDAPVPSVPGPGPGGSGQVAIDWTAVRELARLFDRAGDDVVRAHRLAGPLGGTSSLVGDDEDGRAFAAWYVRGYDELTASLTRVADASFTAATTARDFETLWDLLEQKIIASLPAIPDVPEPPIPPAPPHQIGA